MSREPITPVVFRIDRGARGALNEPIALFPTLPGTNCPATCTTYQHTGQHGSGDASAIMWNTRPAKPSEYRALARELRRIGYRLRVMQRCTRAHYAARVAELNRING